MAGFEDDATTFTRRGLVLGVSQVALFSLLAGRLQYLQVARSDLYVTLAEDNRVNVRLMAPPRGNIFDRNKVKLADHDQDFQVVLIPEQAGDLDATVEKLSRLLGFSDRQKKYFFRMQNQSVDLSTRANIIIDTIHQVKGGEADNVVLFAYANFPTDFDNKKTGLKPNEARVWYTGATRSKQNLFLLGTKHKYSFPSKDFSSSFNLETNHLLYPSTAASATPGS